MKVLAGLIGYPDIFNQGQRNMLRKNLRRRTYRSSYQAGWCLRLGLVKKLGQITMFWPGFSGNGDAAFFQQRTEDLRGKFSRVLNGNGFAQTGIIQGNGSPENDFVGAGITMNP